MYEEYWGLKEAPFENTPDPRFFYHAKQHEEALLRLIYAIRARKGATLLTGEYGCGKTLLIRVLVQQLPENKFEVALLANPTWSPIELLQEILYQLGLDSTSNKKSEIMHTLNDFLLDTTKEGRHTLIIVDEAQAVEDMMTFEELRLLLNFQLNDRFLMTLILAGQPELREKVAGIPQLAQRIATKFHLRPLNLEDTKRYIPYRLAMAGAQREIFTERTMELIHEFTQGTPRRINNICDMSLLIGFSRQVDKIDEELVASIIEDEGGW